MEGKEVHACLTDGTGWGMLLQWTGHRSEKGTL